MTFRIVLHFWAVLVVSACICRAQEADITTRSIVVPGKRGKPDIRWDSTFRGKKRIMGVMLEKRTSGEFVPYIRSFQVGHALVMESDEDRDGFFETLAIEDSDDGSTQVEVFRRNRNGTMRPFPAEELKEMKQILDDIVKFWREALPPK